MNPHIPREVAGRLGHYVYLYVDPRNGKPFYVGKGKGQRVLSHLNRDARFGMGRRLNELRRKGVKPRVEILAHALSNEETALRIEAAVIDLLWPEALENRMHGWRSRHEGRATLDDLKARYAARPVKIIHPVVIYRPNQLYRPGMSDAALYDATRGIWTMSARREGAKFAFAVHDGVVREVYTIEAWFHAGSTRYRTRDQHALKRRGRGCYEFVGAPAPRVVRRRYVGFSVAAYFRRGNQSSFIYVNC